MPLQITVSAQGNGDMMRSPTEAIGGVVGILGNMVRHDHSLLEAALVGYQTQLARITTAIADIQKQLGHRNGMRIPFPTAKAGPAKKKHRISAEGRARIAEAQRKRWAAAKKKV